MATIDYIGDAGPDGTVVGRSATDLIGFHGKAPSDQRAFTASIVTTAPVSVCGGAGFAFSTSDQAIAIITLLNEIHAILKEKGLMAAS